MVKVVKSDIKVNDEKIEEKLDMKVKTEETKSDNSRVEIKRPQVNVDRPQSNTNQTVNRPVLEASNLEPIEGVLEVMQDGSGYVRPI